MAHSTLTVGNCDWEHTLEEAILSGDIRKLKQSLDKSQCSDFSNTDSELEMKLSKIYEELKLKNITIGENMENFIIYKIVDLRFFTEEGSDTQEELAMSLEDIKERIDRVIKSTQYLVDKLSEAYLLDDFFVLECTSVVKDLCILKHLLRSTYDKLPWEEFEFCLVSFLLIVVKPSEADAAFKLVLDSNRILRHIETFKCGLEKIKGTLNEKNINKNVRLARRDKFMQSVTNFENDFRDLYHDYHLIKDISSLRRIDSYLQVCTGLDFEKTVPLDKLVIERTLQVIGECLKDTPESPNTSQELQKMLNETAPKNLKEIITSLRDSLSHSEALSRKVEIECQKSIKFFRDVQNDLRKIHFEILNMLFKRSLAAGQAFAQKVLQCSSLQELRFVTRTIDKLDKSETNWKNLTLKELKEIQDMLDQLESTLKEQPEMELVQRGKSHLSFIINKIRRSHIDYLAALDILKHCIDEIDYSDNLKFVQSLSKLSLNVIEYSQTDNHCSDITHIIGSIRSSIGQRSNETTRKADRIITEILELKVMKSERINDISRLSINLRNEENDEDKALTRHKDIIEIMMENAGECLMPELQQSFLEAFQIKKDLHEKKSELVLIINSKKSNEETIERCKQLSKHLKMKKNNETKFLSNFKSGDMSICKSLVCIIDDPYGLLLDCIGESNVFSYKKQVKAFEKFLGSLKLKNISTEDIMKKFSDDNRKQIKTFYSNRLNLLKATLLGDNLEDQWDAMQKFRSNKKIRLATELMLLDMLNVLEDSSFLFDNRLYLDDYVPIPLGKALRNYLAHGNVLIDVLPFDVPLTIVSNAIKLISEGENLIEKENVLIGKKVPNEAFKLNNVPEQIKCAMLNQYRMYEAAKSNDIPLLFDLLSQGAKLTGRGVNGWTGSHYAACVDSLKAFNVFVKAFTDLESQQDLLSDVLRVAILNRSNAILDYCLPKFKFGDVSEFACFAAECGNEEVLASLISRCTDEVLGNAFCAAAAKGHKDIIELLLKNKTKDTYNLFAKGLIYASKNGHKEIVTILLSNNFGPNAAVKDYASPLYLATRNGHADIVDILLRNGAKVNEHFEDTVNVNDEFETYLIHLEAIISRSLFEEMDSILLLHLACIFGHRDIVEILLNNGWDTEQTTYICTPLHFAVACNQMDTVQLLIDRGAAVNSIPENILSPLHLAAKNGSCEIIDLLLKNDAKIDTEGRDKYTPLHVASLYGHNEAVQLLIAKGSDVNSEIVTGETALGFACKTGDAHIVEDILNAGAEIDSPDQNGNTPLHTASFSGHPNIVTLLLHRNANVGSVNQNKVTPLHCASNHGFIDIINILLQAGADVNECDADGNTPLLFAIKRSHSDTVKYLLEREVNINVRTFDQLLTPLHLASQNGLSEIVDILIAKGATCSPRTRKNVCPLDLAVSFGHKKIVCSLLGAGADVNEGSTGGITPLCLACKHGHIDVVNVLLSNEADVNKPDHLGISPLHDACQNGYKEIVEILLEAGADIAAKDQSEATPLHIASLTGNIDVVRTLLDYGKDKFIHGDFIDAPNSGGETPLFLAAESGSEQLVNLLVEKGARMDSVDLEGYTVLHVAAHNGKGKVVEIFLKAGIPADIQSLDGLVTPLHMAVEVNSTEVIEVLLKSGAQVDKINSEHFSPLHIAAQSGSKEAVEVLLKGGAKINQRTNEGLTEIHYAAQNEDPDILGMLLLEGADINDFTVDGNESTPLHYASRLGHEKVVSFLVENGARINIENSEGLTPLDMASVSQNKNVEYILKYAMRKSKNKKAVQGNSISAEENLQKNIKNWEDAENIVSEARDESNYNSNNTQENNLLPSTERADSSAELLAGIARSSGDTEGIAKFLLHKAILSGDEDTVTKLLNENGDVIRPFMGMLPIQLAAEVGNINIFSSIVAQTMEDYLPVHVAAGNGFLKILNILFAKGCNVDERTSEKSTSLHFAARNGDVTTISLLIEHGADVYARNFHNTVLHDATASKNVEALKMILDVMKNHGKLDAINAKDEDGDTPLMWAIENSLFESATVLLEYGSDVNIQNNGGMTVLHWCVHVDNLDLLELMLKQPGIDTRLKDNDKKTIFDLFKHKCDYWYWCDDNDGENKTERIKIMLNKMI